MRFKSAIPILLSLIISIMSTGCANEAVKEEESFEASKLPSVTLTFYMFEKEKKETKEVLDKVAETSGLNIKLDFKWFNYEDYFKNVERAIAANEKMDAFICGKPDPGRLDFIEMFREGKIKDLTALLPQYAPNIYSQLTKGDYLNTAKVDGKIAFIPPILPMANCLGIYIRKDLAGKYNITSLNSFNDCENIFRKFKENEKKVIPGTIREGAYNLELFANACGYVILDYKLALVYKWDDPEMKIIPWEQTPEFKETASLIDNWLKKGYVEQIEGLDKVGSFMGRFTTYKENTIDIELGGGKKEAFNYYFLYKDKKNQRKSPMSFEYLCSIALNSNSGNIERTLMFLDWIQSRQENYDLLMYGILGKHYLLKDGLIAMPEGMEEYNNPYYGWFSLPFRNANLDRESADEYDPNYTTEVIAQFVNNYTSYAPHEGFYPDYEDIQAICDKRIQLYRNLIENKLQNGTFDMEKADSIIERLGKAGTDRIVYVAQKQLNEWKALN